MAGTKKTKADVKLSDELSRVVDEIARSVRSGSVSEDDVQLALRDVDVDAEELSDLMDALRARGVEVGGGSEPAGDFSVDDDADDDFDDDDAVDDGFSDDEEGESESAAEAKAVK